MPRDIARPRPARNRHSRAPGMNHACLHPCCRPCFVAVLFGLWFFSKVRHAPRHILGSLAQSQGTACAVLYRPCKILSALQGTSIAKPPVLENRRVPFSSAIQGTQSSSRPPRSRILFFGAYIGCAHIRSCSCHTSPLVQMASHVPQISQRHAGSAYRIENLHASAA